MTFDCMGDYSWLVWMGICDLLYTEVSVKMKAVNKGSFFDGWK